MVPVSDRPDIVASAQEKASTSPEPQTPRTTHCTTNPDSHTPWKMSSSSDGMYSVKRRDVTSMDIYSHDVMSASVQECDVSSAYTNECSTLSLDNELPEEQYQSALRRASQSLYWSTVVSLTHV
jgi:heme-binding NEAT domain protein